MLAYHKDVKIKNDILNQLQAHYDADEIIKRIYWENGKGNAIGCTLHSSNHEEYEERFGIPAQLAYLEDGIFEGLPNDLAKEWPIKFMRAINIGADLSNVWPKFAIWLLSSPAYGAIQYIKDDKTKKYIKNLIDLYEKSLTKDVDIEKFKSAAETLSNTSYPTFTTISDYYAVDDGSDASVKDATAYAATAAAAVSFKAASTYAAAAAAYSEAAIAYTTVEAASTYAAVAKATYAAAAAASCYAAACAYANASDSAKYRYNIATKLHYIAQSKKLLDILKNTF